MEIYHGSTVIVEKPEIKIEKFNIKFCINLIEQASKFSQWRIRYEAIKKLKEIIYNL